jgi:hypothetical protein
MCEGSPILLCKYALQLGLSTPVDGGMSEFLNVARSAHSALYSDEWTVACCDVIFQMVRPTLEIFS